MTDNFARATRWRDRAVGATEKPYYSDKNANVFVQNDRIYSYGRHFEMGRPLRDKRGKFESFLLNGDTVSQTTSRHQSDVRSAVRNDPHVIIPFSALGSAGIDLDSIKLLEVTPDRYEEKHHQTKEPPEGARWRTEEVWVGSSRGRENFTALYTAARGGEMITVDEESDGTMTYRWTTRRHWLGESLIRAKVRWATSELCSDCNGWGRGPNVDHWSSEEGACRTCRHRGRVTVRHERWATFLSGFDHEERIPLYFLAELPYRSKAATVKEAYEALKPDPVILAEGLGRQVERQGDIFAIPTSTLDKRALAAKGARFEKRGYILNTNHTVSEVAYLPDGTTLGRGTMYHDPQGRVPDHARHTLGKNWHVLVKNTVPTTRRAA